MPECTVQGSNVHFQDTIRASGRTIVFLHGAGGSHRSWRDQWAGLKGTARLVIPDLPGHGMSAGPARRSIGEYAAWAADFVREIGLRGFLLAGHSMGGAIAQQAALDGIRGLEGLILVGTGARYRVDRAIKEGVAGRFPEYAREMVGMMMAEAASLYLKDDVTRDVLTTPPATFLCDFEACDAFDVRERLPEIRVPTLVVSGAEDRLAPLWFGEYLATAIAGAVLKIVPGGGHMVMLENPNEVNAVVSSFVQSLGR